MDIRAYAKERGETLTEIAKKAGLSLTTLHGYATGRRSVPLHVVVSIEKMTRGRVKARDWLTEKRGAA